MNTVIGRGLKHLPRALAAVLIAGVSAGCSSPPAANGPLASHISSGSVCVPDKMLPAIVGAGWLTAVAPVTITGVRLVGSSGPESKASYLLSNDGAPVGASSDPPPPFVLESIGAARWAARKPAAGATLQADEAGEQLVVQLSGPVGKASAVEVEYTSEGKSYTLSVPQGTEVATSAC